jgi:hypothetical protein
MQHLRATCIFWYVWYSINCAGVILHPHVEGLKVNKMADVIENYSKFEACTVVRSLHVSGYSWPKHFQGKVPSAKQWRQTSVIVEALNQQQQAL